MIDVTPEIKFQTARSGGKGGQHVNKVETMVEGYYHPGRSQLLTPEQKERLSVKLAGRINADGHLLVKSQAHRSQLSNKEEVIRKMNDLISGALKKEKRRVPTKPGRQAKEKRLEAKKREGLIKANRQKIRHIGH